MLDVMLELASNFIDICRASKTTRKLVSKSWRGLTLVYYHTNFTCINYSKN